MPRHSSAIFEELCFSMVFTNNKNRALCGKCGQCLANTSEKRLRSHRKVCGLRKGRKSKPSGKGLIVPDRDRHVSELEYHPFIVIDEGDQQVMVSEEQVHTMETKNETLVSRNTGICVANLPLNTAFNSSCLIGNTQDHAKSLSYKKNSLKKLDCSVSQADSADIDVALENFFFGCKISPAVIDSAHFRNFVKALHPSYITKIPSQNKFSSDILNAAYEKSISQAEKCIERESVLVVDGWKGSDPSSGGVITSVRNGNGDKFFLNAWDTVSMENEPLEQIVNESVEIAKQLYDTTIFAVVADFTSASQQTRETVPLWRSNCSCSIAHLLAQDIFNGSIGKTVQNVLNCFDLSDSTDIFDDDRPRKYLEENDWSSHRRHFKCFLENIDFMRQSVSESMKKEQADWRKIVNDEDFVTNVNDVVSMLDSLWEIVTPNRDHDCTLADVTHRWLTLTLPETSSHLIASVEKCRNMAVSVYALAAYYLHAKYHDNATVVLSQEQRSRLNQFFIERLENDGLSSLCDFENKEGVFRTLFQKQNLSALVFWKRVSMEHEALASLALRIFKIPASTVKLVDACSASSFVQNGLPNGSEKKLMYMYYSLNLNKSAR